MSDQHRFKQSAERGAAVFPASDLGTIAIEGKDRKTWLNGLVTCDVLKVEPGRAAYGLAVVKVGRIITDLWVVDAGELLLVGLPHEKVEPVREHLEQYLMMEDALHENASETYAWAFAHGPKAAEVFAEGATKQGGFSGSVDVTGLGGAVLVATREKVKPILDEIAATHPEDVVLGSEQDWDALRIARHLPRFGIDFDEKTYPQEASLEKVAVSFQKGCYLGQEVVCRLEMRGHVSRKIVPLALEGAELPERGAEVKADGRVIGTVTSATKADEGGAIALAMVRYAYSEPGKKVEIAGREATVLGERT